MWTNKLKAFKLLPSGSRILDSVLSWKQFDVPPFSSHVGHLYLAFWRLTLGIHHQDMEL